MVNKTMEALIGKVKSELNEESKDELLKLITGLNYTEIQDDPVFYLIVKQLEIATKIATYSKQIENITDKLVGVEEAVLILAQKLSISLDSEQINEMVKDTVEKSITENLPDSIDIAVTTSEVMIKKEIAAQLAPLLHAIEKLTQTIEIDTYKKKGVQLLLEEEPPTRKEKHTSEGDKLSLLDRVNSLRHKQ